MTSSETMDDRITELFAVEVRRRLVEESLPRIKKCLTRLSDEEIWRRPNDNTVSIGNLILHLNGNVKQWVISTLGGKEDNRVRQGEFDETGPIDRDKMISDLEETLAEVNQILKNLTTDQLTGSYMVQGFEENGVSILTHVTEHFSYHVGQITYSTKSMKDTDMGYYDGQDLDVTS